MPTAEIKLYKSNKRTIKLIQYAALLGIAGIVLLKGVVVSVLLCWVMILLSGVSILKGLLSFLAQSPYLILNQAGITGSATDYTLINWSQVKHVRQHTGAKQEVLLLEVERQMPFSKLKFWSNGGYRNRVYELKLSLEQLNMDAPQLAELLQAIVASPPEERVAAALDVLSDYQQQTVSAEKLQQTA